MAVAFVAALIAALAPFAASPAAASDEYLPGIDVSRWQGKPVWPDVKAAGVRFVIAKASSGNTGIDPQWERNRSRLRANTIPFGAYHFAEPDATPGDAVAEADHFVDTARLDGKNLLPVLDLERHADQAPDFLIEWAQTWLARVEERLGVKPVIYTNTASGFWVEHMADTTWFADNGYRLWVRHLNVESPTVPAANWGGHGWTIWQYAVMGGLDGISGKVDRNWLNGLSVAPLKIKNNR